MDKKEKSRAQHRQRLKTKLPRLASPRAGMIRMHLMELQALMQTYCVNDGPATMNLIGADAQLECVGKNGRVWMIWRLRNLAAWKTVTFHYLWTECVINDNGEHLAKWPQLAMRKSMIANGIAMAQNKLKIPIDKKH